MIGAYWVSVLLGLAVVAGVTAPAFGGPAVASRWQNASMSQEACLQLAENAIRKTGLDMLERSEQSRYGTRREYTGVVRCITSNSIVVFIGSGPSRAIADQLAGALFHNFSAESQ
jgi:hypothetical protein